MIGLERLFDMASLAKSNKYLKDRGSLLRMIEENTYDSAVFEGASPRALKAGQAAPKRRCIAASKKAVRSA
jgi:hypothetical protein